MKCYVTEYNRFSESLIISDEPYPDHARENSLDDGCHMVLGVASNSGFQFRILSHSFGENLIFFQNCKKISGTESLHGFEASPGAHCSVEFVEDMDDGYVL